MGGSGLAVPFRSGGTDTTVCSQLPGVGDDRLIQTYSHAANPNASIPARGLVCCVIKQNLSVTFMKVFQSFPAKSEEAAGHWRSQSNPALTLLSQSPFTVVVNLHVVKNKVVLLSLNRFTFKDISCLIYTLVRSLLTLFLFLRVFWPQSCLPLRLSAALYFRPPELDFWYFTQAQGLHAYMKK